MVVTDSRSVEARTSVPVEHDNVRLDRATDVAPFGAVFLIPAR